MNQIPKTTSSQNKIILSFSVTKSYTTIKIIYDILKLYFWYAAGVEKMDCKHRHIADA